MNAVLVVFAVLVVRLGQNEVCGKEEIQQQQLLKEVQPVVQDGIVPEEARYAQFPPPFENTICPRKVSFSAGKQKLSLEPINREQDFIKYHSDSVCDRVSYNQFKSSLSRHLKHQHYRALGTIHNIIPNEETIICPMDVQKFSTPSTIGSNTNSVGGMDTTWIVENTASTPIVVAFVDPNTQLEVSSQNTNIYPAHMDPNAILQPGQWMSIHTYEGHEFVIRSVLEQQDDASSSGNSRPLMSGPVLLQYRAGLTPVGANMATDLNCPETDMEPLSPQTQTIVTEFARTKAPPLRPCNTVDIGFRNVANCPLHAYYVRTPIPTTTTGVGADPNTSTSTCSEQFKFHLGTQHSGLKDYMWDWTSTVKYEGSYVGHTFQFRLASNPNVIVDTVTIQPTYVRDCPMNQNRVAVRAGTTATSTSEMVFSALGDGTTKTTGYHHSNGTRIQPSTSNAALYNNTQLQLGLFTTLNTNNKYILPATNTTTTTTGNHKYVVGKAVQSF